MPSTRIAYVVLVFAVGGCAGDAKLPAKAAPRNAEMPSFRIATFNLADVRTVDVRSTTQPRLQAAAAIIQQLRPDVILLNEIAYDQPAAPGHAETDPAGQNGQRFADNYLAVSQGEGLRPMVYRAYMAPSNTGISSGFDLDNNAKAVTQVDDKNGDAYGADCWGFGTFPGQFAMTLLVREGIEIISDDIRTFQYFLWSSVPDAMVPHDPSTGQPWYSEEEWSSLRLSSKSHWDVPIRFAGGQVIHILCSHPTPPVFDGPEDRNGCRNHDEIRFWGDYLSDEPYLIDDQDRVGGLAEGAQFVLLGDLNSDPDEGEGTEHPVATFLLQHPRVQGGFVPKTNSDGPQQHPDLDEDDTSEWGMRVDYVLPSRGLKILGGGIRRPAEKSEIEVSDHFPVWLELEVPTQ